MVTLIIRENSLTDAEDVVYTDCEDFVLELMAHFEGWPNSARLFNNEIKDDCELYVNDIEDIKDLQYVKGVVYCVVYPEYTVLGIGLVGLSVALAFSEPDSRGGESASDQFSNRDKDEESPNNTINDRANQFRLNSRIEDSFGFIKNSVPSLISLPYTVYEAPLNELGIGDIWNMQKVEYAYYCIGRGTYEITNIKDGETLLEEIEGSSAEVYDPNTSPGFGSASQTIGEAITEPLRTVTKNEQVNDILIQPDSVVIDPNPNYVQGQNDGGPFIVDKADFYYVDLRLEDREGSIYGEIFLQQVTSSDTLLGTPVGTIYEFDDFDISSNDVLTVKVPYPFTGNNRVQIRVRRWGVYSQGLETIDGVLTQVDLIDNIVWEQLLLVNNVTPQSFGDITTIYTRTVAPKNEDDAQDRNLTCDVFRKIPTAFRVGTGWNIDTSIITKSSRFEDIAMAIILDPKIGNRNISEIDIQSFKDAGADAQTYFGTTNAIRFNYTFDDYNVSFEETLRIICEAGFCTPYRQGNQIKVFFERETDTSSLLFNHRNKLPNSEVRKISFGLLEDYDGVELSYRDSSDGSPTEFYVPLDRTATNPETFEVLGVTNKLQAYFHAFRAWNTIQYQRCVCEFEATQEALLLNRKERIQIADNTKSETYDGEITAQSGSTLTLSQPFTFESGEAYTIWLQLPDGSMQSSGISEGSNDSEIILTTTSVPDLAVDPELYSRSVYEIIKNGSSDRSAFLVDTKSPESNFITKLSAINYDSRYYQNDRDFLDSIVDENGELL